VHVPAYFLSTREDHIAPWRSTYRGAKLLGGENRFVLAASGHIAGVVNPPDGGKYHHWTNDTLPDTAQGWLDSASEMAGSWWPDWNRWVVAHGGERVPARTPAEGVEAARGSYVQVKAVLEIVGRPVLWAGRRMRRLFPPKPQTPRHYFR